MIILGLTGSIGMGKSTTAELFRRQGVSVYDADATVHALYRGRAAPLIEKIFPGTLRDGAVDRIRLRQALGGRPDALKRLEGIVHPLVREEEFHFLSRARARQARLVVLDIPLLLESPGAERCHAVVVVTTTAEIQRQRVMARPGMTEDLFKELLQRQMPDEEKRRKAHFLVDSSHGLDSAERQVRAILRALAAC
ncbi:dephospho-CoA kinase [Agaricicola taiwanensis]|uniref:Dephospho-CoA kinase n=1 Tax=Agaricicola taiwanensis TaxID=591372 RepID=A0A8J2VFT4_9RHOB|nr:dephospho-CoA kinase [Agaricicola taiwanensis]GGE28846.1 dephospho-CoA kinase [Agaricicola taiwanensis]